MIESDPEQQPAGLEPGTDAAPIASDDGTEGVAGGEGAGEGESEAQGADLPPDRLAIDAGSPHFDADKLRRGVGIRFKGTVRTNVEEYCISEGWVRVQAGKAVDRRGKPLTIKLSGPVEAWYEDLGEDAPTARRESDNA